MTRLALVRVVHPTWNVIGDLDADLPMVSKIVYVYLRAKHELHIGLRLLLRLLLPAKLQIHAVSMKNMQRSMGDGKLKQQR